MKKSKSKKRSVAGKVEGKIKPGLYLIRVAKSTRFKKKLLRIVEV